MSISVKMCTGQGMHVSVSVSTGYGSTGYGHGHGHGHGREHEYEGAIIHALAGVDASVRAGMRVGTS
jgi:hypothetical protein